MILQYEDPHRESVLSIHQLGKHEVSPLDKLYNNRIYSGSQNYLVLTLVYSTKFSCVFDLENYPFDTQECKMRLKLAVVWFLR